MFTRQPLPAAEMATVGFAMSAWGEFAFIIATSALEMGMIDHKTFAALTLAVRRLADRRPAYYKVASRDESSYEIADVFDES